MDRLKRLFKIPTVSGDVEYAYEKTLPLVETEMMLRSKLETTGILWMSTPQLYSAVLVLPWASYTVDLPPGSKMTIYDAWREEFATISNRPGVYVIEHKEILVGNPMVINCPTSVVVLVIETSAADGPKPVLRRVAPFSTTYEETTADIKEIAATSVDPRRLSARGYISLATALVSANPKPDMRLLQGLLAAEGMPGFALERVKSKVFRRLDAAK